MSFLWCIFRSDFFGGYGVGVGDEGVFPLFCIVNKNWPTYFRMDIFTQLAKGWPVLCHNFCDPLFLDFIGILMLPQSTGMQQQHLHVLVCKLFTIPAVEGNNGEWWGVYSSHFYLPWLYIAERCCFSIWYQMKRQAMKFISVSQSVTFSLGMWLGLVCLKLIVLIYQTIDIEQKESMEDYKQTKTPTA